MNASDSSPPSTEPRHNSDPQSVYRHLREAYRSLDQVRQVAERNQDRWPSMEKQVRQAMLLVEGGMGTLELFFLCNAKERS